MRKNNVLKRIAVMSLAVIMGIQTMPISAYADETIDIIGENSEDNNDVVIPSTSDNDPDISLLSLDDDVNAGNDVATCPDGEHQWYGTGTCTVCGAVCSHTDTNIISYDENVHKTWCNDCGILVSEDAHNYVNNICADCGQVMPATVEELSTLPDELRSQYTSDGNSFIMSIDLSPSIMVTDNTGSWVQIKYNSNFLNLGAIAFYSIDTDNNMTYLGYVRAEDIQYNNKYDNANYPNVGNVKYISKQSGYPGTITFMAPAGEKIGYSLLAQKVNKVLIYEPTGSVSYANGITGDNVINDPDNITFTLNMKDNYHVIGYKYWDDSDLNSMSQITEDKKTYVKNPGYSNTITIENKNIQGNLYIEPVCAWYTSDSYPVTADTRTITLSSNLTDHATIVYTDNMHNDTYLAKDGKILVDNGNVISLYAFCDSGYSLKSLTTDNNVLFQHTTAGASGINGSGVIYDFKSWAGSGNTNDGITSDFTLDGIFYNADHAMGYSGYQLRYDNQLFMYGDTAGYVADQGIVSLSKTEDIIPGETITMTITPNTGYTKNAPSIYFGEKVYCDGSHESFATNMVNLQAASTSLPYRLGNMTITACDKNENTGVWSLSLKMGRASTSSAWNVNDMPESMDMVYNVKYLESAETIKDVLIKQNTHGTAVIESKDMDNGQASIKVTTDDGYFYAGYRYAYADTIDDVTEADWIHRNIRYSLIRENPYTDTVWFDITQGKNCIIQPIFERNYATTVPYLTVMGLSKNIKVSDPVQIPGAPSGYVNWTNDCFVSTADNSVAKESNFYKLFGNTYNVSLYFADADNCYSLGTSGTSYYDGTFTDDCDDNWNHPTKPGDTIYVLSKYKQDDFKGYGIQNSGNILTINIPSLYTLDDKVTDGKVTDTEITPVQASKSKYFVGKYIIPDSWPASDSREDRFSCVYPEYRAINYKINTKNVDHGTYTAKNDTPERYNWVSTGYVNEHGVSGKNPIYHSGDPGFVASGDTLPDNLFTYMDTVKCVATPNTGWHVKAWVCMQDGVNIWDGMFDDETADYSTFSIDMTNLGDAEIYPVFEGANPVKPIETPKPTVEPTKEPTPTETPAKTPEPEQEKDEDPEPTSTPEITPEPTEAPKPAVIPVTPTKPDDPEPTETPEPTKAPEKPVKSAEPEVVITPPAVEPVELEDNISKVIPAVLSVTGTGVGGLVILILLKRRKRKFHGIFADTEIPGTKEKYGNTVLNILDLMTKVNDKEINIAEYEDMLNNSDTYTYFPADTKITLITEDAEYSFDANEKKLFAELLNITGNVSIIFKSEEKNIELQYEMTL